MEISQDGNSLLGQLNPQGDSVLHINISFPPRPFPRALTGLSGGTLSPETEVASETFYVGTWVFPPMGPMDHGGTRHILSIERLFPRWSTGLSGGTLPPERHNARER